MPTQVFVFLPPPSASGVLREAHPFGPGASGFNTDLGVEITPGQVASYPALAVVSGLVRIIPDPSPATTGTAVLTCGPAAVRDLRPATGGSVVAFIYRNIDLATVSASFEPRIAALGDAPFLMSETLSARVGRFTNGEFGVWVDGGGEIGHVAATGTDGWGYLGFEVVFVPNALVGDAGWNRMKQIVDTANRRTRRLDPPGFYTRVAVAGGNLSIAPAHAGHGLLDNTVRRRNLLEVRDEYDLPFTGTIPVDTQSAAATVLTPFPAANRGIVVLADAAPGIPPPSDTYGVSLGNHVFTELPSGTADEPTPSKTLNGPAHWALQTIFMADVNDAANWFVQNTPALPRYTAKNRVTHLIDGLPTFREMVPAMRTVTAAGHYLRLAGWWLTDSFELIPGDATSTFAQLTQAMATAGAQVRMMLWDQWGRQNTAEVNNVNALPGGNGRAILDNETFLVGSHHQKMMIVNGSGGALAFCGGVDLNPDRLDDHRHAADAPFHDVHARVEGPAVGDLNTTFVERWNGHPSGPPALPATPPPFAPAPGSQYVQVTRTYAPRYGYPFAPGGDLGTLNAVRRAIQRAERFIYLEEQYATPYPGPYPFSAAADSVGILNDLLAALAKPGFEYLIVVIPNNSDLPQARYRRHRFIRPMRDAFPDKVFVFYPERPASAGTSPGSSTSAVDKDLETYESTGSFPSASASETPSSSSSSGSPGHAREIYVHSKVWIVDDVYAKIGSANCNRRSMTHDTEVDINVVDGALDNGARAFAKRMRMDIWAEMLNMRGARRLLLDDPTHALHYWQHPRPGAYIRPYDETRGHGMANTDTNWNNIYDPDGR